MSGHLEEEQILNVPNTITALRFGGSLVEALQYAASGKLRHFVAAGAWYGLDVVDGPAARMLGQETNFGKDFDPITDKASVAALLGAALVQRTVDKSVLIAVGTVNASNALATYLAERRGVLDHKIPNVARYSQMIMNSGFGLNVIGNDLIKNSEQDSIKRTVGQTAKYTGASVAVMGAATVGAYASIGFWLKALRRFSVSDPVAE